MEEHAVTDEERLKKQMDFIRETDREKSVFRQTWLSDGSRKENDAEHSWHLALMAMLLSEYANESVNTEHVMAMVLIHDLVEIDAGDTYAYDEEGNKTKREREVRAAQRLFSILPKDQGEKLRALWEELKRRRRRKQSLLIHWINASPFSLMTLQAAKAGMSIRFMNHRL